ncbi:hypothetical protein H6G80_10355 [Nostoc sp. FACHB-87]|uniref:hypothetical protein n=2 Tax=Cyanophyceae TaxID=3028117 RepID=UPI001684E223|nr:MULTISPECIES: hypothetical protein [Nostocales]MBD2298710.1 hypothetical protein [Nostoc sp. FACHB-190]MBD2454480.1 hypothetical protein [Nostoc sp. FACHB-87]MBD2474334.1 hypothetical protein [Anabaena sp. FACHB-83]MBD2487120.1 hypothetical protein [Aulosira sp. FACHB-615]
MFRQGYRADNIRKINKQHAGQKLPNFKENLEFWRMTFLESVPFLLACTVFLSVISLHSPVLLFCLLIGSLIVISIQQIGQLVNLPNRWRIALQILAPIVILSLFWLDYLAAPAQAQFFGKAERFFKTNLTQGANTNTAGTETAVSLIFNVLRGIYLLYIAVSLIGVINAVRKDEDWQSIARTPLLVVLAVTIADVMTGFVIGN